MPIVPKVVKRSKRNILGGIAVLIWICLSHPTPSFSHHRHHRCHRCQSPPNHPTTIRSICKYPFSIASVHLYLLSTRPINPRPTTYTMADREPAYDPYIPSGPAHGGQTEETMARIKKVSLSLRCSLRFVSRVLQRSPGNAPRLQVLAIAKGI